MTFEIVTMKGYGWQNQLLNIKYSEKYPDPTKVNTILVVGDHVWLPDIVKKYKKVVMWTDTPLVDCNFPRYDNIIFIPASNFVREILENCEVKNITEIVHRPLLARKSGVTKVYDMVVILTQPQRKGHVELARVLQKLDRETNRKLTLLYKVHPEIDIFFQGFRNIRTFRIRDIFNYYDFLEIVEQARINVFSSQDEGVGYPPLESVILDQQLVMGDIEASNEFVEGKFARIVDVKLERLRDFNHWLLLQIWDEGEFYELLRKALDDPTFNKPRLRYEDVLHPDELWERVMKWVQE